MAPVASHIPLTCNKFWPDDPNSDWWVVERVEHDGRRWNMEIPWSEDHPWYATVLMKSSRLVTDDPNRSFDVEGTGQEMHDLADAIERRTEEEHKRCSVKWTEYGVEITSPRNNNGDPVLVTHENAIALAKEIRKKVPNGPATSR